LLLRDCPVWSTSAKLFTSMGLRKPKSLVSIGAWCPCPLHFNPLKHSGNYICHLPEYQKNSEFGHTVCFIWFSQWTAIVSSNIVNQLVFLMETQIETEFSAYFPYFENIKGGLWDRLAVCLYICPCPSTCLCIPSLNFC
jgi:hypothetical protein